MEKENDKCYREAHLETLDILDAKGQKTGRVETIDKAHQEGLWHGTVHVWIYDTSGKFLIQKRSPYKSTHPNRWDISCAGHIQSGESSIEACLRECQEEIGLKFPESEYKKVVRLKTEHQYSNGLIDHEWTDVYLVKTTCDTKKLKPNPLEVSALDFITPTELLEKMKCEDPHFVPHHNEVEELLKAL